MFLLRPPGRSLTLLASIVEHITFPRDALLDLFLHRLDPKQLTHFIIWEDSCEICPTNPLSL